MTFPARKRIAVGERAGTTTALLLLFFLTLFRLVYASRLGLIEDETYYWQWSRHLDVSYYDQGPGIACCIRAGTALFGDTTLGVRFVSVLLGAATSLLTYATVLRWTRGAAIALTTLALLNVAPLLAIGGVLATYDGAQVFCWTAALYALTWTVQEERAVGWYVVGALTGLGLLCKITMLLFAPCVLLFLLWSPKYRHWLRTPHPYLAFALALALFTPVLGWNATHGWMNFRHSQALSSRSRGAAPLRWLGDFVGGQAGFAAGPLLFLAVLYTQVRGARAPRQSFGTDEDANRFFVSFTAPILLVCLVLALKSKVEVNWSAPMYPTALAAVAAWFVDLWQRGGAGRRAGVLIAAGLSGLISIIAYYPALLTSFGKPVSANAAQKLNETYGWGEISRSVQSARENLVREGRPVFVAGVNYRVTSELAFYLPDQPQTQELYLRTRRDEYVVWTRPETLIGENALLCVDNDDTVLPIAQQVFGSITPVSVVDVFRPGFAGAVKHWTLYACRDFKGYDPEKYYTGY